MSSCIAQHPLLLNHECNSVLGFLKRAQFRWKSRALGPGSGSCPAEVEGLVQPSRPPCPSPAISQPAIRYRASREGKIKSTTFGLADRKQPGAETTGISSL